MVAVQDFAHYKTGVYKHLFGGFMGGHAVKLIGWGTTDDGVDYWVRGIYLLFYTSVELMRYWRLSLNNFWIRLTGIVV